MLSYLLRQLINSFGIFFRTIRAFFTRKLLGAWSYLRRITNFSRQATKVATVSFQEAATAVKKPTKREDYIETQRLFISKSFLVLLAVGLVLAGLLIYFVVWPFLLSRFFVAKFYQGDPDLTDWSGKVIVYYDEEKRDPMYRGTLEEGLLQGRGEEYNEEGLLTYAGNFVDGVRSGDGCLYDAGVLTYEGSFSGGLPNGMGAAYADGVKCYQGDFVDGLYEGTGTAYYPDGTRAYVGAFAQGLYEGEGTAYTEDGQIRYKGSFAQGLYKGSGTVYLDGGGQIQAQFAAGVSTGAIQWYQNGKLWYDGSADDLTPDGFGTLYAENGKAVYAGEFDRGTLDGAWLLSLTAGELREAFADADLTERDSVGGFVVENTALGLTALCSYQQEESETQVYRLWFAPDPDGLWADLLPWESGSQAAAWAAGHDPAPEERVLQGAVLQPDGAVSGDWYQRQYSYEDYMCTLLSQGTDDPPAQLCWSRDMSIADGLPVAEGEAQAQERLDALLAALDGADGETGGQTGGDQGDPSRLLGLVLSAQDGEALADALIDSYVYGQMAAALEAGQPLLQQELADAQARLQRGEGTQEEVDAAQAELDSLDGRLAQYRTAREQAGLTAEELTTLDAGDYDLSAMLLFFDPLELDADALYDAALTYAQAVAGQGDVDGEALRREVKSAVLELGLSYESVRSARTAAEAAAAQVETATQAYAKGTVTRSQLYDAQLARDEAAAALYQALGTFAHQANGLNTLTGGWLSGEYDWMADTFAALFQGEILRAEAAAAQAEADRTQREEAAAQTIQGQQTAAPAQTEETVQPTEAVQAAPTPSPAGAETQN